MEFTPEGQFYLEESRFAPISNCSAIRLGEPTPILLQDQKREAVNSHAEWI